jgi:hypothetical protein
MAEAYIRKEGSGRLQLSLETQKRVEQLFPPDDWDRVSLLLIEECGENLPLSEGRSDAFFERIRFAVLKLSYGEIAKLNKAIRLAQFDWRDLLVAAGFADDPQAHHSWLPDRTG